MDPANKKENAESLQNYLLPLARSIYGDMPHKHILHRIQVEAKALGECGVTPLDFIQVQEELSKLVEAGHILVTRSASNSLLCFLTGLSHVNPLPRHTYCPKCHLFYWGHPESKTCPDCQENLKEDGYDLPLVLFLDDFHRDGLELEYFSNVNKTLSCHQFEIRLLSHPLARLASQLGLKQEDIHVFPSDQEEIIHCLNPKYYAKHYLKERLFKHQAFIGLPTLGSPMLQDYLKEYPVQSFDELVNVICLMRTSNVFRPLTQDVIASRDDLYHFLKRSQLNEEEAVVICRENRICGSGHLSPFSQHKLHEAGVNEERIRFLKEAKYLPSKGPVISLLQLELILAKIFLEDPLAYYKAYWALHPNLCRQIQENEDFIKRYVESQNSELETLYSGILDLRERGFNPQELWKGKKVKS